jgi:Tol biopolymer transport system component
MAPLGVAKHQVVYFVTGRSRRNLFSVNLDDTRASGPAAIAADNYVNMNLGAAFSRDGAYLAYYSMRTPVVLVVRDVKANSERTVSLPVGVQMPFDTGPKWFPDNRSVLILSADAQGPGKTFQRLWLDTGKTEELVHVDPANTGGVSSYDLSPDGNSIFYILQHPMHGGLKRFDIDARRETELRKGEWFVTLSVSPDGKAIACMKSIRVGLGTGGAKSNTDAPGVIEVIPAAGGPSREAFTDPRRFSGARYNALTWSSDGRFILFVRDDGALWKIPSAGGSAEAVGVSMTARIKSPTIHPDGKHLIFAAVDADNNEVWVLENFLPAATPTTERVAK